MTDSACLKLSVVLILIAAGCRDDTARTSNSETRAPESDSESTKHTTAPSDAEPKTVVRFEDVAQSAGVVFEYRNDQDANQFSILETLGGGVAVFDYDNDHRLDLYYTGGGRFGENQTLPGLPGKLFRQSGEFRFRDVTAESNSNLAPVYSHGAWAADYDNDGFKDLLVTGYGKLLLFHNQGDGTFRDVTVDSGLIEDQLWSTGAAWADLNGDGMLDLYVAHYVDWSFDNNPVCHAAPPHNRDVCPPRDFGPLPDVVFENNGDGTFANRTEAWGLKPNGKGLGVVAGDVDIDGDVDLYVANDEVPNFLYRNNGQGILEEVGLMSGTSVNDVGIPEGSMGVDMADFNLDGLPDLWCVNFENESLALYRNEGNGFFQYVSRAIGIKSITNLAVSWGTAFFDADCDLDEDVFVANGHVLRFPANATVKQLPMLLQNEKGIRFSNVSSDVGQYFRTPQMGRGAGLGDINDDGNLDLAVSHVNEPVALLKNETAHEHHWIGFRLIGRRSPRDSIGARVEVQIGERRLFRQIKGGGSYLSTSDLRLHFGLAESAQADHVVIDWPSGHQQVLEGLPAGQYHTVIEDVPQTAGVD